MKLHPKLSTNKYSFLIEGLNSKSIPHSQLLIKDHKKPKQDGRFPMRLVIPATNFTATFLKIGYLGMKRILDEHKVNYAKYTIVQACDLKERSEQLNLTADKVMLMLLDINSMYPLICVHLIWKALDYYRHKLAASARKQVHKCMEIVKFGIRSTLIYFQDKYYKYSRVADITTSGKCIGLAIGGYKSAILIDLVASYLLTMTAEHFTDTIICGIYRDNGLVVFDKR
eukprot:1759875-Ditylum_brightwellii.AAC.1